MTILTSTQALERLFPLGTGPNGDVTVTHDTGYEVLYRRAYDGPDGGHVVDFVPCLLRRHADSGALYAWPLYGGGGTRKQGLAELAKQERRRQNRTRGTSKE